MTRDQVKEMLDRVLTWPPEAQEEAVASLATIEEQFALARVEPMSMEEVDAEVKAVRASRRQRAGGH